MNSPRVSLLSLAGVLAIAVAACGNSTPTQTAPPPTVAPTPAPTPSPTVAPTPSPTPTPPIVPPKQLTSAGRLWICTDLATPPQTFADKDGNPAGADIEIAQEIARRLDLYPVIQVTPTKNLGASLLRGGCDVIVSAQVLSAAMSRSWSVVPYFQSGQVLLVARGNPANIDAMMELCNKAVGARKASPEYFHLMGSTGYGSALGLSANCLAARLPQIAVNAYGGDASGLAALKAGKIVAYLTNLDAAAAALANDPASFQLAPGVFLDQTKQVIVVKRDHLELKAGVEQALRAMMIDQTYIKILQKYGLGYGALAAPR